MQCGLCNLYTCWKALIVYRDSGPNTLCFKL